VLKTARAPWPFRGGGADSAGFFQVFELALHLSIFEAQLKLSQAVMHLLQGLDLPHQFLLFVIDGLHGQIPGQLLAAMILQNGLHFLELETELLSAFDEGQQLYALLAVDAVLAFALRGGGGNRPISS